MFGHLKAEDFINAMEGSELSARDRDHLKTCARCRATWDSTRSVHAEMTSMETDIPEPDWTQFRSSVRDELLSRSIQRQTAVRRWTGWSMRPAVAWGLSLVMVMGITTVTVLWKVDNRTSAVPAVESQMTIPEPPAAEIIGTGPEKSLFDDVVSLGEEEQEQLRQMLESAQTGTPNRQ
jgi:hypothetical protein